MPEHQAVGSDPANIIEWLRDLTFREVHAFTWGFGLISAAILAGQNGLPQVETAFYVAYVVILGRAMLGRSLRELLPAVKIVNVPKYVIKQVRAEMHYYIGGGAIAYALQDAPLAVEYVRGVLPALPF